MCGIVGYLGNADAYPILISGLKRLEYRGYDSAGIAINEGGETISVFKQKGRVDDLSAIADGKVHGTIGIGHTRWATHGVPNVINAHPHTSGDGVITLVHNGIIENYAQLKEELSREGWTFISETDTEVLANVIARNKKSHNCSLQDAVVLSLKQVRGAYAICVLEKGNVNTMVLAKKGSPLAVGVGVDGEFFIGSDAAPIIAHTKQVMYLEDGQIATLHRGGNFEIHDIDGANIEPNIQTIEWNVDKLEKDGFDHFMLKEIYEQPAVIRDTMRGRLSLDNQATMLGGIADYEQRILRANKLTIIACGTSWHAGMVGKYLIEELAHIPVNVELASEFRYGSPVIGNQDVVLAISQSGETADTLAALEMAKEKGALTLGLVNVVGSSIARITDAGVYTHAGPEVSVASTKAFSTQVTGLTLMALRFAQQLGTLPRAQLQALYEAYSEMPELIQRVLQTNDETKRIAEQIIHAPVVMFLGRGNLYPVALEGALKLKEITYIAAEGYAAGEMKHGPIALIQEGTPVIVIAPKSAATYEKIVSNIQEVKARGGRVIAIVEEGDVEASRLADEIIVIPSINEQFLPALAVVPLQLLSYHAALLLGRDVDKPRNLAKSVTVE